jgi:hypothetical protein
VADLLLVFVKWPEPGFAKTRLIPALGPEVAAAVSRLLAEAAIAATCPPAAEYDRLFCFTPATAEAQMQQWLPGESVWPQPDGDLGQRMAAAFREAFARGASRVALVGTDIPWITRGLVARGFEGLEAADVVLGPADDGGYYLVALSRPQPELFAGIAWSTPQVFAATCERAEALGLRTSLVDAMADVDGILDLTTHWDRLEAILGREPAVRDAVFRALGPRRPLRSTIGP